MLPATSLPPSMPPGAGPQGPLAGRVALWLQLIRWNRPVGWLLLLWPTLGALWLAARGFPGGGLLFVFTAGTILMRSAGCAVNDVADRDFDRHVKRTARRPVTTGAVGVGEALAVGAVLALAAFALVLQTNRTTVLWSVAALGVTLIYPWTKRFVSMPQAVLGVAFSMGIPMAFAAVQGRVPAWVAVLVAANLAWVLAYDTMYAMVDRDDDLHIGIRTSAITLGRFDRAALAGFNAVHFALWAWVGRHAGLGAPFWLGWAVAAAVAATLLARCWSRGRADCMLAFQRNHWVGAALFAGVAAALH